MTVYAYYESPLGKITMEAENGELTGLWFTRDSEREITGSDSKVFDKTRRWLKEYFAGERPDFVPELCFHGTSFRNVVWDILRTIPYGETMTYGEVAAEAARRMGKTKMSARAVGGAVGHNPICLIIPCHRVIGSDGSLTGYGEGLWRKEALLRLEQTGRI